MNCPCCNSQIATNDKFCPKCGQSIIISREIDDINLYWETVNREDKERNCKQKAIAAIQVQKLKSYRKKVLITNLIIMILVLGIIIGGINLKNYQDEMIEQVRAELIGKSFTAHDSHMEGMGWIYHEYWQLSFDDAENLDYAYIETIGPAEDNEKPEYKGSYRYTISRSIIGNYSIKVNGSTFKLKVNEENVPIGISQ